jgi:hypothetical protein
MQESMLAMGQQHQVFWAVILPIAVYVMDIFMGLQRAPENLLHN